jgi:hypothetical protein
LEVGLWLVVELWLVVGLWFGVVVGWLRGEVQQQLFAWKKLNGESNMVSITSY